MTATIVEGQVINTPGVYEIDDAIYHADPVPEGSLSCSGAKKLLPPSCPAIFDWERNHPPEPKAHFDLGHAAHKLALGVGPDIVEVEADSWRTNAAKDEREAIREAGGVPLLTEDYAVVKDMAAALAKHPIALDLFSQGQGEASLFWVDEPSGIWRRARLDWLPDRHDGRMIIPDYKTARSADPEKFAKSAVDFGYAQQVAYYTDGVRALDLADDNATFVFVVQEKTAPYVVSVVQLDVEAVRIGRLLNRRAINIFKECTESGRWPGFSDDVELVSLPFWYERQFEGLA